MKSEIGVLGGSFNPPHKGHVFLASYAMKVCGLEKVIFVPTGRHAFDSKGNMTPAVHRVRMVELALKGKAGFEISEIEVRNPEKSYTYNTLRRLNEEKGEDARLRFITGSDEILEIHRWYEWEKLLSEFSFIIAARPGVDLGAAEKKIEEYRKAYNAEITLLKDIPAPDISSTGARRFIEEMRNTVLKSAGIVSDEESLSRSFYDIVHNTDLQSLPVEAEVLEYSLKNNLYRGNSI